MSRLVPRVRGPHGPDRRIAAGGAASAAAAAAAAAAGALTLGLTLAACGPQATTMAPLAGLRIQPAGVYRPESEPLRLALVPAASDDAVVAPAPDASIDDRLSFADGVAADVPTPSWDDLDAFVTPTVVPAAPDAPVPADPADPGADPGTAMTVVDAAPMAEPPPPVARPAVAPPARAAAAAPAASAPTPPTTTPPTTTTRRRTVPSTTGVPGRDGSAAPSGPILAAPGVTAASVPVTIDWRRPTGTTIAPSPPATVQVVGREERGEVEVPLLAGFVAYRTADEVVADSRLDPSVRASLSAELLADPTRFYLVEQATMGTPDATVAAVFTRVGTGRAPAEAADLLAESAVAQRGFVLQARVSTTWFAVPSVELQLTRGGSVLLLRVASLPGDILVVVETTGSAAAAPAVHHELIDKLAPVRTH